MSTPASGHPGEPKTGHIKASKYKIDESNLAVRRTFLRLTQEDAQILTSLLPWARQNAAAIAREFYEFQFSFPPTRQFFERRAQTRHIPINKLRTGLEQAQAQYFIQIFEGAASNWGVQYFENRLHVGWVHDKIDLPFKWYVGSYAEYQMLTRKYLRATHDEATALAAEMAIFKVFNYDTQAITDAFLLSFLESMGFDVEAVRTEGGSDLTEHIDQLKSAISTVLEQAQAISEDRLRDPIVHQRPAVAGLLGASFGRIADRLSDYADLLESLSAGHLDGLGKLDGQNGILAKAMQDISGTLRSLLAQVSGLVEAAQEGRLKVRTEAHTFQGAFRDLCEGLNQTLDSIIEPINEAASVLEKVSNQDLTVSVTGSYRGDHAVIKDNVNRMIKDLRESMQEISQGAITIAAASEELTATSHEMARGAEETARQSRVVASATEQASKDVSTVATGSHEMEASVKEIARNAHEAARVARDAVGVTNSAAETIGQLGDSSAQIGKVVKVITSIAHQTNLLALNATIEAARAGEAGKGFAVVANEVKELAKETATATEEIGQRIDAIQRDTKDTVQAIDEIRNVIGQINDISSSIAASVEQQTATTKEMGFSLTEVAKGTVEITGSIRSVSNAAENAMSGANGTMTAAKSLSELAADLNKLVGRFKL